MRRTRKGAALEKNVKRLYWMNVLDNAQFHLVVYTLFLLGKGFSTEQFFIIESSFALITLLMEVPTGAFSDRKSRKWSLVAASLIGLPVVPVIIVSHSFAVVLAAMAVGGISAALVSGTDVAIMYDTLIALGREQEFKEVAGRMRWQGSLAMALSGIAGGLLAQLDLSYAWWAYFGAGALGLLVRLALLEPPLCRASQEEESYLLHLGRSLRLAFAGEAAYFVLYAALVWLFFSLGFWLWQPYLERTGLPVSLFGFVYAALNVVGGTVSRQAHRIERRLGMRASLLIIPLLLATAFLLESQFTFVLGFSFLFVQSIASGWFGPLLDDYINRCIPSSRRATVLSIKNMVYNVLFMALSPLVGRLVDVRSVNAALLAMGIALVAVALVFAAAYGRRGQPAPETSGV